MTNETKFKELFEEQSKLLKEFRETHEKREKKSDIFLKAQEEKLEKAMAKNIEATQRLEVLEKTIRRPGFSGDKGEIKETSAKVEHQKAFAEYMKKGNTKDIRSLEAKALSTDIDPEGGYLVPEGVSAFVVKRMIETSPMRLIANIETTANKSVSMAIDDGDVGAEWSDEGSGGSETSTFETGILTIPTHKMTAIPRATDEQLEDAGINMESWLQAKVADKFVRTENTAFVNGNGIARPRGFLTYPNFTTAGTYERGAVEQIASGTDAVFVADGLIDIQTSLKEVYQAGAVWTMKRSSHGAIAKLKDTANGQYLLQPGLAVNGRATFNLLSKRIIYFDDMPVAASNALALAYGDFGVGYTILDRLGISVLRDPYTVNGFVLYKTKKRVGGAVTNYEAIKLQKLAASV